MQPHHQWHMPVIAMKYAGVFILAILATGCTSPIETRVSSIGENTPASSRYFWGNRISFGEANEVTQLIESRLLAKGLAIGETAPMRLDATFSALPAALKLRIGNGAAETTQIKPPRKSGKCEPVEYRFGLSLSRLEDGAIYYRSNAAEYHCKGNEAAILPMLIDAALVDIGSPKGNYSILRKKGR